jgi:carboxyl-terminal processing protease
MSSDKRRVTTLTCSLLICLSLAFAAGFGAYLLWNKQERAHRAEQPLGVFWQAWNLVEENYYGEMPSARARTYGAIRSTLALLDDPYTVLVEPQARELERDQMRGAFGGIGVALRRDAQNRIILSPYPDSPAQRAGVREGDILLAVDAQTVMTGTTVDEVEAWLHGEIGTVVTLTLSRPPTLPFALPITREEIQVPSVTWRVLDQSPQIGYIHITGFTERTHTEVLTATRELRAVGVISLVLDLRDNYGGLVDPAVATAGQFLHDGVIVIEQSRSAGERVFQVQDDGTATDVPLAVLINGGTASAAEIVAGALQDHHLCLRPGWQPHRPHRPRRDDHPLRVRPPGPAHGGNPQLPGGGASRPRRQRHHPL